MKSQEITKVVTIHPEDNRKTNKMKSHSIKLLGFNHQCHYKVFNKMNFLRWILLHTRTIFCSCLFSVHVRPSLCFRGRFISHWDQHWYHTKYNPLCEYSLIVMGWQCLVQRVISSIKGELVSQLLLFKEEGGTRSQCTVSQTVRRDPVLVGSAETERW